MRLHRPESRVPYLWSRRRRWWGLYFFFGLHLLRPPEYSSPKNGCPKRESEWMTRRRHNKRLSSDWIDAHSRAERERERETGGRQSERRRWRNGWKTIPECSALYLLSLHQTSASGSQSTALTYTCTLVDNNSLSSIAAVVYTYS